MPTTSEWPRRFAVPAAFASPAPARESVEVSRRDWLRRAAVVSGAAAATALVAGVADAAPAAALDGDTLKAGQQTNAEASTVLFADGASYQHGVFAVTDTVFGNFADLFPPFAGVIGYVGQATSGDTGVAGFGSARGVFGQSESANGIGVVGLSATGPGVVGSSPSGPGVVGSSASGAGVEGTSSTQTGVFAASGNGVGAQVQSDNNQALWAKITLSTNAKAAVRAETPGAGAGINATSALGVGGVFAGKTAQIQLVPSFAKSHPASGAAGQLFVDHSNRLWFCKGGTKWHQLA